MKNTPGITHECSPKISPKETKSVTYQIRIHTWNLMRRQTRSNRIIARPIPTVRNTICVITRSLIAMTSTDTSSSAEQMCSTERARSRSKNSTNALRGAYVAVHMFPILYSGYSLTTNSLATQS